MELPTVKRLFIFQAFMTLICGALMLVLVPKQVVPFLAGAALISINFAFLAAMWQGILDKKAVARTILVVVFKYAILGALLYIFVREFSFPLLPLFAGVSTLGLSFVVAALQVQILQRSK